MKSQITSFAPGRVELLGNHTDYNAGVVMSGAIQYGVTAQAAAGEAGLVELASGDFKESIRLPVYELESIDKSSWARYPAGVVLALAELGVTVPGGLKLTFTSDLPSGAGLSSSAALEVATALAVLAAAEKNGTLSTLEIAKLCKQVENEFVGVSCGLLDQVSSAFGKAGHTIYLDCRTEGVENVPAPAGVALLVAHSGVAHRLTGGEYNERRAQCFSAAEKLGVPFLRDVDSATLEANAAKLTDLELSRARHIVGENERVFEGIGHLRAGNAAAFGKLMFASHRSSMENFANSTPELDALVDIAAGIEGVYGSRLTGGGFGGATVSLVDAARAEEISRQLAEQYAARTGNKTTIYPCVLGDGAHVK
jgi:galactokinase